MSLITGLIFLPIHFIPLPGNNSKYTQMKKIFHVLFLMALTLTSFGQRDVSKTLEVLDLPTALSASDGIITRIQSANVIVVERTIDHTVRTRDTSEVYRLVPTTSAQNVSFYSLNYWNGRLSGNPNTNVDDFVQTSTHIFERPMFIGATGAWYAGEKYEFSPDGSRVIETRNVGLNTVVVRQRQGLRWVQSSVQTSFENPPVQVTVRTFIKDSKRTREVPTRITENRMLADILKGLNLTRAELESRLSTTYTIEKRSANHIHSSCTEAFGDASSGYRIKSYYDGIDIAAQRPSGRITSYNKQWPGVVQRWIIYNGQNNHTATGATQVIQYSTTADQASALPLKFVAGAKYSYDATTNTVTYNANVPCQVWAVTEEMPAQYKQHQTETIYTVVNGELVE